MIEPVMLVEINAPNEFQNAVHALVAKRFGIVSAIDPREDWFTMMAEVTISIEFFIIFFLLFLVFRFL